MKNIYPYLIVFTVFAGIIHVAIRADKRVKYQAYVKELQQEGYSPEWAVHKALVEYRYIDHDSLYDAIEED